MDAGRRSASASAVAMCWNSPATAPILPRRCRSTAISKPRTRRGRARSKQIFSSPTARPIRSRRKPTATLSKTRWMRPGRSGSSFSSAASITLTPIRARTCRVLPAGTSTPAGRLTRSRTSSSPTRSRGSCNPPLLLCCLYRPPNLLRRHRHFDMGDAEFGERVDHGVDDGAERAGGAAFAGAAHAEPVGRREHFADVGGERRQDIGARHGAIHERSGQQLALGVIGAKLPQRLADALCNPAVGLAVHHHRIDGAADVVDRGVTRKLKRAGLRIDLDLANMRPARKAELPECLVATAIKRSAQVERHALAVSAGGRRHVENSNMTVGAFDGEAAAGKGDIVLGGFEQMRGDFFALLDDDIGRLAHDDAGEPHRARGMRAAAFLDDVGVALVDIDIVEWHAEPFRYALRKGRLVTLPAGQRADDDIDAPFRM